MPRKCSVYGCRTGYRRCFKNGTPDSSTSLPVPYEKVKVFGFPSSKEECHLWISALPNANLQPDKITKNMGICEKHWPENAPMQLRGRHLCPSLPPSCFSSDIPKSSLPSAVPSPRSTSKSLSAAKAVNIDETHDFIKLDSFSTKSTDDFHKQFVNEL